MRRRAGVPRHSGVHSAMRTLAVRHGLLLTSLIIFATFSALRPSTFPTLDNMRGMLGLAAPSLIIATGLTVVLVLQDFDLSFGAVISLASGTCVWLMAFHGAGWGTAVLGGLAISVAIGAANGLLIAWRGSPSFITTLAMGTVATGIEFGITNQNTIAERVPSGFSAITDYSVFGVTNAIWIAFAFIIVTWFVLDKTEYGRYMYAIGGNIDAARLSGLPIARLRTIGLCFVALCAGAVGVVLSSQGASYVPGSGVPYLLPAYASVFLGTAAFRPGQFNMPGTVLAVLFLQMIETGLTMVRLQTFVINLVQGGLLLIAIQFSRERDVR